MPEFRKGDYVWITIQCKYSEHQVIATRIKALGCIEEVIYPLYLVDCEDGITRRVPAHRLEKAND